MSQRQGSVLILSYLTVFILGMLAAAGLQRSVVELVAAERYVQGVQAFHLAEGGVNDSRRWLRRQGSPPSGAAMFDPFNGPQSMGRGRFRAEIDPDDNNPTRYVDLFTITVTGESGGVQVSRRVIEIVRTESFARYAYFTNSELLPPSTPIWFTGRDHLQGPVHSNDRFNISGSPVFDGPVSSSAGSINYRNPPPTGGNNPRFNGGLALDAATVQLPLSATPLRVAASSAEGAWYTGNTTLVFQSDGTMLVTNPVRGWVNRPQPTPPNGAIFVNSGNATVSGTVNGQVTVGTSRDVIIANNLRYADNPRVHPQSDDVLGLMAEQNVVVSQSAPANVTLEASVMALNTSFTVENWWQGPPKGTLTVHGGIIQKQRGPVGSFNGSTGQQVSGYAKDYSYDARLSNLSPPFYPTTGAYEGVLWQED